MEDIQAFSVSEDILCFTTKEGQNCVLHLVDLRTEKEILSPRAFTETVHCIAFDKTADLLVIGFKSGSIVLFPKALLCFKGRQKPQYFDVLKTSVITEITIGDACFYVGTNLGIVSKFDVDLAQEKVSITRILELNAAIFQMDWSSELGILLVSSLVKTVICNTKLKTFSEVGKSPRNGKFGGCILTPQKEIIVTRPGKKLWKASLDGNVTYSRHFQNDNATLLPNVVHHKKASDNFSKVFVLSINPAIIVSFSSRALFLMKTCVGGRGEVHLEKTLKMSIKTIQVMVKSQQVLVLTTAGEMVSVSVWMSMTGGLCCSERKLGALQGLKLDRSSFVLQSAEKEEECVSPISMMPGSTDLNEDDFILDLEAFFSLPGDIISSQATSLLSEKISSKAKELIQLSKSRLQTALGDLSDNLAASEVQDEGHSLDLQRVSELAQSIVDKNGQVVWWRDYLLLMPELFEELDENSQKVCKNATTAILKCHIDPDTLEEHWNHAYVEELFEFHSKSMDFVLFLAFVRGQKSRKHEGGTNTKLIFKAIQEAASEDYPNIITNELLLLSYVSLMFDHDQDLALDLVANYGFIFSLQKLLFLAASFEHNLNNFHHLSPTYYEEFLDKLVSPDGEFLHVFKLQKALCICFSRKWIMEQESMLLCNHLSSKEQALPSLLFMRTFSKVEQNDVELLQFGLGLMNNYGGQGSSDEKLYFCKQAHFWPGLKMLLSNTLNEEERWRELPFVLSLKEDCQCLEAYFQGRNQTPQFYRRMIATHLESSSGGGSVSIIPFESIIVKIMEKFGGNNTKNLLLEISKRLPKGILSARFYNLLLQQCLYEDYLLSH